jgi:DHA1 family bicyclomycin/chloramphenicol resistance-like MFS transporter
MNDLAHSGYMSTLKLAIICGVLTAFPAMSIDLGLPGFSNVAIALGVPVEHVSQTLSFFFLGFSVSPLLFGPLSDRVGRRPVLLAACAVYAIASLFAAMTSAFDSLLFWRLLQGTGAGVAAVLAITVIRDHHQGAEARKLMSYAAVVRIIGPTTAPTLGNLLLLLGTWRWIYAFMALGGVLMLLMVAFGLPESTRARFSKGMNINLRHPVPDSLQRRSVLKDYRTFLSNKRSLAYALIIAFTFGSFFSYITGSLYVYVNMLHLSTVAYGVIFAVMALCLMLGSFLSGRLAKLDLPGDFIIGIALAVSVLSSLTTLTLSSTGHLNAYNLTALLSVSNICLGLLTPCAQQGAMEKAGEYAGTASALMNAFTTGMGACASYVEGLLLTRFHESAAIIMSGQMAILCGGALLIFGAAIRKRPGELVHSTVH